jgi:cytoskeletal protein CcmA (bactofilin family)
MTGNIQTPHLIIEDGAVLHGNVSIDEEVSTASQSENETAMPETKAAS